MPVDDSGSVRMNSRKSPAISSIGAMTLLFGMVLLCFIWIGLYWKIESERQLELQNAIKETTNYAKTFEENTTRTIKGLDQIAVSLKYDAEKSGLLLDIPKMVNEKRFEGHPYVQIGLADEKGDTVISSIVPFVRLNVGDLEHFQVHREKDSGKAFISKPIVGRTSGKWSIQISRRINKPDGSFGGVVVVSVDPYYFAGFYQKVDLGANSSIALFGMDGIVRVRQSDTSVALGLDFSNNFVMQQLRLSPAGSFSLQSQADGIKRIYSYRALQEYPLVVAVGMSEEQALLDLNQRIVSYYWICSAMSFLTILFIGGIMFAVRKRKQAEESLRLNQERYRALMEQSFEALAVIEVQTKEIVEVNRKFAEIMGYSLPHDAPLYINRIADWPEEEQSLPCNDSSSRQGMFFPQFRTFRHKNGSVVPVESAGTFIHLNGREYLLVSSRDMTAERRRQAELQRDVNLARRVQSGLLPELQPSSFVSVESLYYPSSFVSGDSYYMQWENEGKVLRGFLYDVSGHGLATAIQTASLNVLMREATLTPRPISEQLQWVNARLMNYFTEGAFAAIIGFELDLSCRELRYVGAGITQFFVNGKKVLVPGMFAGLWEEAEFQSGWIPLAVGDIICFLTDGFTDVLAQTENAVLERAGEKDFDAHVAELKRLAESGLRDDASGVCLQIKALL